MIQRCRKTLHSRTKENRVVIQIQKALWRKLETLFSRNKLALRFKRGQRKCACIRGQILPTIKNNYSKSICVSWPLSVKHAANIITFAQWKCRTFQSIIYPAGKKNFIGISNILAWGKSRVGPPPPFIASNDANTLSKPTKSSPPLANNPHILVFKVDRLQIILVAKQYIYLYVSQLFIGRMPKMRAIPQLVSAPLNPIPIAEHFRRSHPPCEHSHRQCISEENNASKIKTLINELNVHVN